MWSYYGAKTNIVGLYPPPKYDTIIEPFAGSARYALKYWDREVILIDKYPVIVGIWKWLQQCSVEDIKRLPHRVKPGQPLSDFTFDCQAAKDLVGFLIGFGMERPRVTASVKRMTVRPNHVNYSLNRIAANLFKIKSWTILEGDYSDIQNTEATWFVDPPYVIGGHCYQHSSKSIDFEALGEWCETRMGQVIVCENMRATWMDFAPLASHKGAKGMQNEAMWTNMPSSYNSKQTKIFQ